MYVYICTYVYVYIYCIYIYTHTHIYTYTQSHIVILSWDFIIIWICKRFPGDSNGQQSLGITLIKNNLRDGVRRPLLIRWSGEGLFFKDEKKKTLAIMSHNPEDAWPGQANYVCNLLKLGSHFHTGGPSLLSLECPILHNRPALHSSIDFQIGVCVTSFTYSKV